MIQTNLHRQVCTDFADAASKLASSGGAVDLVFVEFSDAAAAAPLLAAAAVEKGRRAVAVIGVVAAGDCAAAAAAGLAGTVLKPFDRAQVCNCVVIP